MITINEILPRYCFSKNLPPPSKHDYKNLGNLISHHFKSHWCLNHPDGIIHDSGFIKIISGDLHYVVNGYPKEFEHDMCSRFDIYYDKKSENLKLTIPKPSPTEETPKIKTRGRIQKPAFSGKQLIK